MQEKVQAILQKIVEWWKKFTTKQKTLIGSLTAVVLLALVLLAFFVSKPTMVRLITCEDEKQAAQVRDLLEAEKIPVKIEEDKLTFMVNKKDEINATYLLGTNEIASRKFTIENVFDGGFSATEADKNKKYQLYLEQQIAEQLAAIDVIESASVKLSLPIDDGTIVARDKEAYASIALKLKSEMDEDTANGIAKFVATAVGNKTTDCITILDSNANVLFSGGDSGTDTGTASTQMALKKKAEAMVKSEIKSVVLGTDLFDNVEVGLNLNLDFDKQKIDDHMYYVAEGATQGYLDSRSSYNSETTGGTVAGEPGTGSNDTTYTLENGNNSTSTISDVTEDFVPNEKMTSTEKALGAIVYDKSSVSVVATQYVVYDEDTLKAKGELKKMTFDEYVSAHQDRKQTTVPPEFYTMVEKATGFTADNISIVSYQVPFFQYSSNTKNWSDYVQIILAVLIFLLLGYVVFRSTRKEAAVEMEPELSMESLLASTKSATEELENIGYNEKSETRLMIERFVDEKPEAVASLLRNWIDEEWE
ncbi:MAG: flagellar M-ring protein FliF C-terminal domain-containing protein [Lachnospiraceae bacterium]